MGLGFAEACAGHLAVALNRLDLLAARDEADDVVRDIAGWMCGKPDGEPLDIPGAFVSSGGGGV